MSYFPYTVLPILKGIHYSDRFVHMIPYAANGHTCKGVQAVTATSFAT